MPAMDEAIGHSSAVIPAGGNAYGIKSASQSVHGLGKGNAVFLSACGVAPLEFEINLSQAHIPFDIPRPCQTGIPHF